MGTATAIPTQSASRFRGWWTVCESAIPRGIAGFLGAFALLNVIGELRCPGFDANPWWIKLPVTWYHIDFGLLAGSALCLLWFGLHRRLVLLERLLLTFVFTLLWLASLLNAVMYYRLLHLGTVSSRFPVPFSLFVLLILTAMIASIWRPASRAGGEPPTYRKPLFWSMWLMSASLCALLFPLAQMACFGFTDYRREADLIVVLGAKVYPDGRVSSVLDERVRTGCELYSAGLAPRLLFSGGPGTGDIHEVEGMRRRALELGVPNSAILLDHAGLDTDKTVTQTLRVAQATNSRRIMAVSQFYHLPRIKLAFRRQGSEVYTVPARQIYQLRFMPYFMLREVAAWWLYYVRPLWTPPNP